MKMKCARCTLSCLSEFGCDGTIPPPQAVPLPLHKGGLYRRFKRWYRAWKFVRKWNKKNKDWRECRHKRKRRAEAMRKAGIKW